MTPRPSVPSQSTESTCAARPTTEGYTIQGRHTTAFVTISEMDETTHAQVLRMANHPAATNPIAIMPDAHAGKGCCVGFTMPSGPKVVPNWIGVDIGCGMLALNTGIEAKALDERKLASLDEAIRRSVPLGMSVHDNVKSGRVWDGFIHHLRTRSGETSHQAARVFASSDRQEVDGWLVDRGISTERFTSSVGTLGGGNHFIEMGASSEDGTAWVVIHTGSRNAGKRICEHFDLMAQKNHQKGDAGAYAADLKQQAKDGRIRNQDIASLLAEHRAAAKPTFDVRHESYLEGEQLGQYLQGMFLAQTYAEHNRGAIAQAITHALGEVVGTRVRPVDQVETVHNYINFGDQVIRKGAVSAHEGERLVIPFNMRDGILLCRGKGNPAWNNSAPHGAGRVLSRSQAKQTISLERYQETMRGIFTTSVGIATLDESPFAYKDAAMIERAIAPTAGVLFRLKPIYNLKAGDSE